jgi:hypothetical protein
MSFWGNLGRGALKVGKVAAPIALGMTGVGIPAAMAVSGGLNALDKKVSGGSWMDAAKAGAMGAGEAAAMGGASKGIPGMMGRISRGVGGQAVPAAATTGIAPSGNVLSRIMAGMGGPEGIARTVGGAIQGRPQQAQGPMPVPGPQGMPNRIGPSQAMMRDQMNSSGYYPYSGNPNLGVPLEAGRNAAMMNQPWRRPPINPDPTQQLPPIYPQY